MKREVIEQKLGLDRPVYSQYVHWAGNIILHGSLGKSLRGEFTVNDKLAGRLPVTFELGLMAIIIGLIVATPIGIYSAVRQDTIGDYLGRSISILFISIPSFWLGAMVMIYPSIWWRWSPPIDLIPFTRNPLGNLGMFLIPAFILGMGMSGGTMRMIRTMMLEVMRQDYVRTAWAKGLRERVVITRHAIRNAFIPVATLVGYQIPMLVGGAVIIEQIFQLPGIGRLSLDALNGRDYTVVSGINLVLGTVVMFSNLVTDLTYGFLDPRVRYR
jgi:peptide/nickel transport system permease protein